MPHLQVPLLLVTAMLGTSEAAVMPMERYQPFVSAFSAVPHNQRAQWVTDHVLARILQASEFALSPENLALQRRFVGIVDSRLRGGARISGAGVSTLLRKMESLEQLATDKLLARYDQIISERFQEPRDRELRMRAWQKVYGAWTAAGEPAITRNQLIAWLDGAISRLSTDATAKLPALPDFGSPQIARIPDANSVRIATSKPVKPTLLTKRITAKPPLEPVPLPAFNSADADVNVAELNTQIARYNLAAASITAKLSATDHSPIEAISEIVDELEELSQRHSTICLYIGLLEPTDAQLIVAPKSLDSIIAMVASRIFALRREIDAGKIPQAETNGLRARLANLSKRLARLVSNGEDGPG
jgi:hypothetical protein